MKKNSFIPVIGLEVHVQLNTQSKIFSGEAVQFGAAPNTRVSPLTISHPGTLPVLNIGAVEKAIRLGLTFGCTIANVVVFDRKNYFYPDLPKGYQITQDALPICSKGELSIFLKDGKEKIVTLHKIHLEEDAGKSLHDQTNETQIDLNRAGTALVEIVTNPCMSSSEEVGIFLSEIRRIVRYLDISDGNMEEGSLRCDANISIHKSGEPLGTKVEIKNMNSFRHVMRAVDQEIKRQIEIRSSGGKILSQTRMYNPQDGTSSEMRSKETAMDYRYFPEPDISPFLIDSDFLERIKASQPILPKVLIELLEQNYGCSKDEAMILVEDKTFADFYLKAIHFSNNYKILVNIINGPIRSIVNEVKTINSPFDVLSPEECSRLSEWIISEEITFSHTNDLLKLKVLNPSESLESIKERLGFTIESDHSKILQWVNEVVLEEPQKVLEYRKGKKGLIAFFMGKLMKKSNGKINPKLANEILEKNLIK